MILSNDWEGIITSGEKKKKISIMYILNPKWALLVFLG